MREKCFNQAQREERCPRFEEEARSPCGARKSIKAAKEGARETHLHLSSCSDKSSLVFPFHTIEGQFRNHLLRDLSSNHWMQNLASLRQIPYNGKKSKPAALRKDHWHPLARIILPKGHGDVGRSIYGKLREYKKLHELSWDPESMRKENGELVARKDRRKILNDQKPNVIADMAVVLDKLNRDPDNIGLAGVGQGTTVEVLWTNMQDAYYASEWPENVLHDSLKSSHNNRDPTKMRPFNKKMSEYVALKQRMEAKEAGTEDNGVVQQRGRRNGAAKRNSSMGRSTGSSQHDIASPTSKRRVYQSKKAQLLRRSRERRQFGCTQLRGQGIDRRTNSLKIAPAAQSQVIIRPDAKAGKSSKHGLWSFRPLAKVNKGRPRVQPELKRQIVVRQDPILIRRRPGPGTWALRPLIQAKKMYQEARAAREASKQRKEETTDRQIPLGSNLEGGALAV